MDHVTTRSQQSRATALIAMGFAAILALLAVSGCSSAQSSGVSSVTSAGMKKGSAEPVAVASQAASASAATSLPACAECAGAGKAAPVKGEATVENGVQVVKVGFKSGYYSPNTFTVKAGSPVTVQFAGPADDCLGHPVFQSLGKKADLTKGPATLDLGTLPPGTYKFACSMGMNVGSITVQ
jgi:plastocyanin